MIWCSVAVWSDDAVLVEEWGNDVVVHVVLCFRNECGSC